MQKFNMEKFNVATKFYGENDKGKTQINRSSIFLFVCGICPMTVAATFCGLYWGMWSQAMDVNERAEDVGYDNGNISAYDTCGYLV